MGRKKKVDGNSGIYAIINCCNNKKYIGQSISVTEREEEHFDELENGTHFNEHLQRSFNKYGKESFIYQLIEFCKEEDLDSREIYYIAYYKSADKNYGYNKTNGGQGSSRRFTDEVKKKIGMAGIGRIPWNKGIRWSEEMKCKMSESHKGAIPWNKGKVYTAEESINMGKGQTGKIPWNKGIPFNEEVRKKMSDKKIGISPSNKGISKYQENMYLIVKLFKEGNSARKISKILGIPDRTIVRYLHKQGFKLECNQDKYGLEITEQIVKLREEGFGYGSIAKLLNIGNTTVRRHLEKYYKSQKTI